MQRAIKFRAWDKKNKLMSGIYEPFRYYDEGVDTDFVFRDYELPINSTDVEIMQDTGLKDKKGKAIYEGDIVNWFDELGKNDTPFVITYHEAQFVLTVPHEKIEGWHLGSKEVEVIGNIYENPELLKSK